MQKSAIISSCGKYRYRLERTWDTSKWVMMFIMLNPSIADAEIDDPTIRRCIGFAESWWYGWIIVWNLFPFRATNPKDLIEENTPFTLENSKYLYEMSEISDLILCAWWNQQIVEKLYKKFPRYMPLVSIIKQLSCIELSKGGVPKHPLYLKKSSQPISYQNK